MEVYKNNCAIDCKGKNLIILLLAVSACFSCRKDKLINTDEEAIISPTVGSRTEFTIDSIFLYAKQIYLWNDVLPNYGDFRPREKYKNSISEIVAFRNELYDISQIKINQATGRPFEISGFSNVPKYSNIQVGRRDGERHAGVSNATTILVNRIIRSDDKIIGYLALETFPKLSSVKSKLDQIFDEFAADNPSYLILDLRTNNGGYIETAEYLANLISPAVLNGKIMYSEKFNSTLQNGKATILRHQLYLDELGKTVSYKGRLATLADVDYSENGNTYRFNKKGKLETIKDIYVIVSGETASASELLISCLKPYFNVKLIGETTFGKPVGFFGINIDNYSLYLSSFLIMNAQGWCDYFDGMRPDFNIEIPAKPVFGDLQELGLKSAIDAINGEIKIQVKKNLTISKMIPAVINHKDSITMIENRFRLKPYL